jgi:hypothetical protein
MSVTIRAVLGGLLAVAVTACAGIGLGGGRAEEPPGVNDHFDLVAVDPANVSAGTWHEKVSNQR